MKKNTFIIRILDLGLLLFLVSGCKSYLDLKPQSEVTDLTFWNTPNDFELAANWFYANSLLGPEDGGTINSDNMSDIAINIQADPVSSGTYVAPEDDGVWNGAYSAIRNANKLIEEGEKSSIREKVLPYLGEGYFFRAYNYFHLLKSYGGVPLIKDVLVPGDKEVFNARATMDQTVDFIISDLDSAIVNLNAKTATEKGRLCKEAATAFQARVALFAGTWRKFHNTGNPDSLLNLAISASRSVIDSKEYSLYTARGIQSYRRLFIDATSIDNPESIIVKPFVLSINNDGGWQYGVSWGPMSPTKTMADMYLCTDGLPITKSNSFKGYDSCRTEFRNRDPRMAQSLIMPGVSIVRPQFLDSEPQWPGVGNNRNVNSGYMLYKFISEIPSPGVSAASNFDWNVMRYAEVLLIYAEATYERYGQISDADLAMSINALRDRVGMPHLTNAFVNANGLDMRTEIRRERTVELAFEGFRWDDLRRWGTAETELPKALLSIKVTGTQWDAPEVTIDGNSTPGIFYNLPASQLENGFKVLQPASQRTFDAKKNYLLPIPTRQISLNPDLKQNPGW